MAPREWAWDLRESTLVGRLRLAIGFIGTLAVWLIAVSGASALDLTVDTVTDNQTLTACTAAANDCSLRGAILRANAVPGPHNISVPAAGSPYYLTDSPSDDDTGDLGDLDILQSITIQGAGLVGTVISGNETESANRQRIFHVLPQGNLTLRDLSVRKGGNTALQFGGGVYAEGPLTIERVQARINIAQSGGGIFAESALLVRDSTISANAGVNSAGGVFLLGPGSKTIRNSTIAQNAASGPLGSGGGLYVATNGFSPTLNNVTISGNTAYIAGGILAAVGSGNVQVSNTIVAGNAASFRSPNCEGPSPGAGFSSLGYNLEFGGGACNFTQVTDQSGDPRLDLLQDNGGPTPTHALLTSSAATDKGSPATPGSGGSACEAADQRGLPRALDGDFDGIARCDIGAVEGGRWFPATTTTDSTGGSSLRGLIGLANALAAGDSGVAAVITLTGTGPSNPYQLTLTGAGEDANVTGDLDVKGSVTIVGQGATTTFINGNGGDRVFHVGPLGSALGAYLALKDLTVENGSAGAAAGGGVWIERSYAGLIGTRVRNNTADSGGGIAVGPPTGGSLAGGVLLSDSSVFGNHSTGTVAPAGGGGVFIAGAGTTRIRNSTISGNTADGAGGGLAQRNTYFTRLDNVTISGNQAGSFGVAGNGGGVAHAAGQLTVVNTIIASNNVNNVGGGTNPNCSGTLTSVGYNLVFGSLEKCNFSGGLNDVVDGDPKLGSLQINSGSTETMALGAGSAAIDKGNPLLPGTGGESCGGTDQRGVARPIDGDGVSGGRCDIGAYEAPPCTHSRPNVAILAGNAGSNSITVTITAGSPIARIRGNPPKSNNVEVDFPFDGATGFLPSNFDVAPPGASSNASMTLRRPTNTGTGTLSFFVTDVCGEWETFAGGGDSAWGTGSSPGITSPASTPVSKSSSMSPGPATPNVPGAACGTFASHAAAQAALRSDPSDPLLLDRNRNGVACEGDDGAGFVNPPLDHAPVPRPPISTSTP